MMCQEFGLGLSDIRELLGQHLGNLLMVLLPCAPEQRLIESAKFRGETLSNTAHCATLTL